LLYHPETLQPYCAETGDCTEDHPNCVYTVAKRGTVIEMLDYKAASAELDRRVKHFIETNDLPYIAKFIHEYGSRALCAKADVHTLTRIARFIEAENLQGNVSEAIRRLLTMGLEAFEARNMLSNEMLEAAVIPDELPPVPETAAEPEKKPTIKTTSEPVPVPVKKAEPEPVPEASSVDDEPTDDEFVF
jgi:hypothetical protein